MARTPLERLVDTLPLDLAARAHEAGVAELLGGGDVSVYFAMAAAELLRTAVLPVRVPTMPLRTSPRPEIGSIEADTKAFGRISLDDFLARPDSYAQGFVVAHRGAVVYESFPRMRPEDHHLWMSDAKPTTSLVIDLLIDEGKLADGDRVTSHLPVLAGTAWDQVSVKDVLDMTPGLDTEENGETRADPDSLATRLFLAEFGFPYRGRVEGLVEVLRDAEAVAEPGRTFDYSSANPEVLVLLAEAIEQKRWVEIFDERVWSKIGAEAPLQVHTTPDGIAAAHGFISSTLRDHLRFGMLYTPSWGAVATEPIVTAAMVDRIRSGVRGRDFYRAGFDGPVFTSRLGDDEVIGNSRMWDGVWSDGDFWKSGLMAQGIYVSPDRDLVIAFYSLNLPDDSLHRYLRPLATSGLFDR